MMLQIQRFAKEYDMGDTEFFVYLGGFILLLVSYVLFQRYQKRKAREEREEQEKNGKNDM